MSEVIINTNNTVKIETQTLQETKTNKTPSYTLKAQKTYYNKKKDNPEFKNVNNEKANIGVSNYKINNGDIISWKYE